MPYRFLVSSLPPAMGPSGSTGLRHAIAGLLCGLMMSACSSGSSEDAGSDPVDIGPPPPVVELPPVAEPPGSSEPPPATEPPGGSEPPPPPEPPPPVPECAARSGPRPNFVILLTDDQERRLTDASYTPAITQRLVDGGLSFDKAYVTTSLCCPSRTSILSGQYAHNHRVLSNDKPRGGYPVAGAAEAASVAVSLNRAGYETAFIGKYINQYPSYTEWPAPVSVPPGWTHWFAAVDVFPKTGPYNQFNYNMARTDATSSFFGSQAADYFGDVITRDAAAYFESVCAPFLAFVSYVSPHGPATPAPRHAAATVAPPLRAPAYNEADMSDKPRWIRDLPLLTDEQQAQLQQFNENRARSMLGVDESVEQLLGILDRRGIGANTYVFFLSDNGLHMGEHRLSGIKDTPYEEAIGIPFFARGPSIAPGRRSDALVLNIDLAPTILDLAGIADGAASMDGRSLKPLLLGEPVSWRTDFLVEHFANNPDSINKVNRNPFALEYAALHRGHEVLVDYAYGDSEYYDLAADPSQSDNRAATMDAAAQQAMRQRLQDLMRCAGDACRAGP